ncbi:helix-turn-helix domain-containing protein (plasmid) [Macrococcoides canis]|uniref:Helix-turn-helix domain-containing protein n=1 Tax=Macrococcoides canis TaxID=1855823 RepID=A0AAE6X450_9STAP|nr:helix-turn-helix domain-containing protein [Macrococcus canis]QIH79472.1 helix-turn-helix domain-containing protein [Macrococcus canis]
MNDITPQKARLIRLSLGLSKKEFSELLSVSHSVIEKYEADTRNSRLLPARIIEVINDDIITLANDLTLAASKFKDEKGANKNDSITNDY